jgi:Spy/CpxP family protein refolding chaperone
LIQRSLSAAAFALIVAVGVVGAQAHPNPPPVPPRKGRGAQPRPQREKANGGGERRGGGVQDSAAANRQELVRRVRQAYNDAVKKELDLSDDKWHQLQDMDRRYTQQRQQVTRDERSARLGLKSVMEDSARVGGVDQARISQYMDQLLQAQHRRVEVLDAEQKELATVLTPLQRAKYQGMREQLTQRIRQLQQQNARGGEPPPPDVPPPRP